MHPTETLHRLGGVASWSVLQRTCELATLRRCIDSGDIVRLARGRYALPIVDDALAVAHGLTAVLSHRSAALHHGWAVATVPEQPDVMVRSRRRPTADQRARATIHYSDLEPDDVCDGVTTPHRTLTDCLRSLPEHEALAVADSALRSGDISATWLRHLAEQMRGPGAAKARRVASRADARAANPFESVLRHHALGVKDLRVVPQLRIRENDFRVRPDLVDADLRIVVEADSFAFHSSRAALRRDCRRYTGLTARGWLVLRFSWEDVMFRGEYVIDMLERAVSVTRRPRPRAPRAA